MYKMNSEFIFVVLCMSIYAISAQEAKLAVVERLPSQKFDFSAQLKLSEFKSLLLSINGLSFTDPISWKGMTNEQSTKFPKVTLVFLTTNKNDAFSKQTIPVEEDTTVDFNFLSQVNPQVYVKSFEKYTPEIAKEIVCSHPTSYYVINMGDDKSTLESDIQTTVDAFKTSCGKDEIVAFLLSTNKHQIVKRQTRVKSPKEEKQPLKQVTVVNNNDNDNKVVTNKAEFYSDQYPAMFNLLFWTSLILGIAIFSITYSMWSMDPGLDTVIYRMTSQRIKKDQ